MGIFELTPSIRADTEAFNKALKELGWSKDQYHRKIKRAGLSLADKTSTKNFLNHHLEKKGSSFRYKNILQAPTKIATETGMGGVKPGRVGAPANEKIWRDGAKIQKVAEKKFKNLTDQRKFFVETMKKLYKNVPKSKILHIFKNILRGVKSFSPIGLSTELMMQMMEKNPELLNILNNQMDPSQVPMARKGGMMDINEMTRPLGYSHGGISDIEMQKRANYHDLGRDDWMSLDEYLLSGLSDKDLGNAEGGMIGYEHGGLHEEHNILPGNLNKAEIGALLAAGTTREELPGNLNRTELKLLQETKPEVGTFAEQRSLLDKLKSLFRPKQYEGGDNPYYMKFFDKHWKEGYGQEQIDMLWNTYKDDAGNFKEIKESLIPSRTGDLTEPFTGAKGGIVSLNHLTRKL